MYRRKTLLSPARQVHPKQGHCVEALFVVLADKGFFPEEI